MLAYLNKMMNFLPVFIIFLIKSKISFGSYQPPSGDRNTAFIITETIAQLVNSYFSLSLSLSLFFFLIQVPLGSIPELPAYSCQEIKASEDKDTISSKYWLDPTANGTAILVYCDMELEGY